MATINLGRVKPVFRGAYAGGTAYVVDDIVTYSNETYICILASTGNLPTDTTYWTKLAAKGTDGTDVSTTLTTQGDLLYRDGSGLQRLGAGTSGQALITNGTGANPSWGTISSPIEKVSYLEDATRQTTSTSADVQLYSGTFTKTKASSKIYVMAVAPVWNSTTNGGGYVYLQLSDGTNTQRQFYGINRTFLGDIMENADIQFNTRFGNSLNAGTITLSMGWDTYDNTGNRPFTVLNPNNTDDSRNQQHATIYQIFEVNE